MNISRRDREKEKMKALILGAAADIITEEGLSSLSIRKIAKRIEYSPSIIYHYFADKEEILNSVMQTGYKKIIDAVSISHEEDMHPGDRLRQMTKSYINAALSMPDEFMAVQLNDSPKALKYTSSLFEGASGEKPALRLLYECVKEMNKDKSADEASIELTAQMVAVSTLGLIMKLITEKNTHDQEEKLIEFFSNETVMKIAVIG